MYRSKKLFYVSLVCAILLAVSVNIIRLSPTYAGEILGGLNFDIPFLPTASPNQIKPTTTPSALLVPPEHAVQMDIMDPISNPPVEADLAPDMPQEDKVSVVLQNVNGKRSQVFMSPDQVTKYLSNLPKGILVVTTIPPASLMGKQPPFQDLSSLPKTDIVTSGEQPNITPPPLPDSTH